MVVTYNININNNNGDQAAGDNCSLEAPLKCGWWNAPVPGDGCAAFFKQRCSNATLGSVVVGVLGQ